MTHPADYADHLAVLWFIWRTFALAVLTAGVATLVSLGAARLRRSRGGLGRGRVERNTSNLPSVTTTPR